MNRPSLIKTIGRLAAAIGILAGLLLFAGTAAADGPEGPSNVVAFANAPGAITIAWDHPGDGVYWFVIEQESPFGVVTPDRDKRAWTVLGLEPNRTYRYLVCAVYEFHRECADQYAAATTHPAPPPPGRAPGGTPPPPPPSSTPTFTPELTASPAGGAQVNLKWNTPPAGSIALTAVPLYRDGEAIYQALQPGNLDGDHADIVRPNSTHRYMICFEGPAIGERCSKEIVAGPAPVAPTAPADLRVAEVLRSGGRTAEGILLQPKHEISLTWRNTDIPGIFLTVEREDLRITRNADPNSPVGHVRRPFWNELARLKAIDNPTSALVDAPDASAPTPSTTLEAGNIYRVCAVVPSLGDAGKVCTQPLTPEPPAHVRPAPPIAVPLPTTPSCHLRAGGC